MSAVTNAERKVSYVVIKVSRYDDVAMVDLGVQNTELVVDLRGTLPWVPAPPPDEEPSRVADDGTALSGAAEAAYVDFGIETMMIQALNWFRVSWDLIDFWPHLVLKLLNLDSNFRPTSVGTPLILIHLGILEQPEIVEFRLFDFLLGMISVDVEKFGRLLGELAKDLVFILSFCIFTDTAVKTLQNADILRLAALSVAVANPGLSAALAASCYALIVIGGLQIGLALACLEMGHQTGRELGLDDEWSMLYFLMAFLMAVFTLLSGIDDGFLARVLASFGEALSGWLLIWMQVETWVIPKGIYEPVSHTITIPFVVLILGWVMFRLAYYVLACGLVY